MLDAGGDLRPMAQQVRSAFAWVAKRAACFGGDPRRIYIGGHSSGGHLALLHAPVTEAYGSFETAEFQRQGCDFAAP